MNFASLGRDALHPRVARGQTRRLRAATADFHSPRPIAAINTLFTTARDRDVIARRQGCKRVDGTFP
jgi:hypothetical protein